MREEINSINNLIEFVISDSTSNTKKFCRLGLLGHQEASSLSALLSITEANFEVIVDSDGMRHTLAQHGSGKSVSEALRGQIPIVETDFLALPGWIATPTTMRNGQTKPGKQPRVEFERIEDAGTTVVVMEWRPGRQQLALVTMYKKRPAA